LVGKIAEKAVCRSVISDNMALYFECRIGDFLSERRTECFCLRIFGL